MFHFIFTGVLVGVLGALSQSTDEELVLSAIPPVVTDHAAWVREHQGRVLPVSVDFVALDLDGTGEQNYLAAVYFNTETGALRLLKKEGDRVTVIDEPRNVLLGGSSFAHVYSKELDGDDTPEVIVEDSYPSHPVSWPFRWTGTGLALMAPTTSTDGLLFSALVATAFHDIDGDGVVEALPSPYGKAGGSPVYQLRDGVYTDTGERFYFGSRFVRSTGTPDRELREITVAQDGLYTLRILNGDPDGSNRVSSAQIWLNGSQIVTSSQIGQQAAEFTLPVDLLPTNMLEVRLAAQPYGYVYVLLVPFEQ